MVELISIQDMPNDLKIELLRELGYDSDGKFVLKDGEILIDEYIEEKIRLDNMAILPGSIKIFDNNPFSISSYLEDFGDDF